MHNFRLSRSLVALSLCALSALAPSLSQAASQCQGLQENACQANVDCAWVGSYTRKDGRTVSSHCKLKRGAKPAGQAAADGPKVSAMR